MSGPSVRVIVPGRPDLEITDRFDVNDKKYRYRARLKGRSLGGYAVGFGRTEVEAIDNLRQWYEKEIEAIEAGREGFLAARARRR